MNQQLPPFPSGNSWKAWATNLVEYLTREAQIESRTDPQPLQLPWRMGNEKATQDGLMMYDAVLGVPIYSKNGQWLRVSDDTVI